jgi:hypothetical protein
MGLVIEYSHNRDKQLRSDFEAAPSFQRFSCNVVCTSSVCTSLIDQSPRRACNLNVSQLSIAKEPLKGFEEICILRGLTFESGEPDSSRKEDIDLLYKNGLKLQHPVASPCQGKTRSSRSGLEVSKGNDARKVSPV